MILAGAEASRSRCHNHVIHVQISRQRPFPARQIVTDASQLRDLEPVATQPEHQFRWPHEFTPVVCAARQPAEKILGADNGQCKRGGGAVQRRANERASWLYERPEASEKNRGIGDVLDDFKGQYYVEAPAGIDGLLDCFDSVVDPKTRRLSMRPSDTNCFLAHIDSGYSEPEPRHRFGDEAPAAAYIHQTEPLEWSERR
jgi:hypothetical protein